MQRAYGPTHPARPTAEARPPLDELILTVLSQNTSDLNRDRAWASLRAAFPRWEDVLAARLPALQRAIAPGGLAATKAPRIKAILAQIEAREGSLSLARLKALSDADVRDYLMTLPGIGPKTAACVLAFSLGRPALPVDTHVARIGSRLGLIEDGGSLGRAQEVLESLIPAGARLDTHLNLIAHGRTVCLAQRPACDGCVLLELCPTGELHVRNYGAKGRV